MKVLVPVKRVPLRVAKFDVVLKESALAAVHAKRTMLTRMVLFTCNTCRERFPTFHPAYMPPSWLNMHLLRQGRDGLARCNVEVASWDAPPLFSYCKSDLLIAASHTGVCKRCHVDLEEQKRRLGDGEEGSIVAKFGERRGMRRQCFPNVSRIC